MFRIEALSISFTSKHKSLYVSEEYAVTLIKLHALKFLFLGYKILSL